MIAAEEPLYGSGLDDRNLVRIGDTVRRPAGPWSPAVQHLLGSLRATGLALVPEPLGFDEQGREVLSFLAGRDQGWPFLPDIRTDRGAENLGELALRLRTALADYGCPPDAVWQAASGPPQPGEAMQHGDLGPWNLLWDNEGAVCGVLDWDFAGPGDPWYDTGHLAWFTVPFQDDERAHERGFPSPPDRGARLPAFARGAGVEPAELVRIALRAQQEYAHRVRSRTVSPYPKLRELGLDQKALRDNAWTRAAFPEYNG
jgi:hypothetical protein